MKLLILLSLFITNASADFKTAVITDQIAASNIYENLFKASGKEQKTYNDEGDLVQSFVTVANSNCIKNHTENKTTCFIN